MGALGGVAVAVAASARVSGWHLALDHERSVGAAEEDSLGCVGCGLLNAAAASVCAANGRRAAELLVRAKLRAYILCACQL